MTTINKGDLIKHLSESEDLGLTTKAQANRIVDGFLGFIKQTLLDGGEVRLNEIGTLKVVNRAAREGKTFGREYNVPESKAVKFVTSKVLKSALNA